MKNINSAYRIRKLLIAVKAGRDSHRTYDVWCAAFGVEEADVQKKRFLVSKYLSDLHEEVESVKRDMEKSGFSTNLYLSSLNGCNTILGVQFLEAEWRGVKGHISNEILTVLGFCSEILPNEEDEIDQAAIAELSDIVTQMKAVLEDSNIGSSVRRIIESHVIKVEEAVGKYNAVGAKTFSDALQSAVGEIVINEAALKEIQGTEEFSKLKAMWTKLKEIVVSASSANSHIDSALGLADKANKVGKLLEQFN